MGLWLYRVGLVLEITEKEKDKIRLDNLMFWDVIAQ